MLNSNHFKKVEEVVIACPSTRLTVQLLAWLKCVAFGWVLTPFFGIFTPRLGTLVWGVSAPPGARHSARVPLSEGFVQNPFS